MKQALRLRMLLAALLPVALVAVTLTFVFLHSHLSELEAALNGRGRAIARQLATAAEFAIFSGSEDAMRRLAEGALTGDGDLRGAAIVDDSDHVLARAGAIHPESWRPGAKAPRGLLVISEDVRRSVTPVDDIYGGGIGAAPAAPPKLVGRVVVEISEANLVARRDQLLAWGAAVALLGVVLGGWLAVGIARGIATPVLAITDAVERIGNGETGARVELRRKTPLDSLVHGINAMAERVGLTQEELRLKISEATAELLMEKETAEHATAAKSRFLAAASHDLRQPMHALGLFVSSLAQSSAAKSEAHLVVQIQSAVTALQEMLDALLDISRLDGGTVIPRINSFSLRTVLDRMATEMMPLAEARGQRLRVRRTGLWATSDRQMIERILQNLIGNALNHTAPGGQVLLACRRREGAVLIEVWDTGAGIPDGARQEIFEEYVQLNNPERDRAKGLGLGLAICRRLAELLGHPIGVRSRVGRGSVFWIELPQAGEPPLPLSPTTMLQAKLDGLILVVEDDPLVADGMQQVIGGWGGRVVLARSRAEALALCDGDETPALLLCDLTLAGGDSGIALANELRALHGPLEVLLVSADVSQEAQVAARQAGFALLKKPVPVGRLRAALQHLLK